MNYHKLKKNRVPTHLNNTLHVFTGVHIDISSTKFTRLYIVLVGTQIPFLFLIPSRIRSLSSDLPLFIEMIVFTSTYSSGKMR